MAANLCVLLAVLIATATCTAAASSYQTVQSRFSNNTIRYKTFLAEDTSLCNSSTIQHTGWADIGQRHLFFWFHEARHKAEDAPVLIWHQGGPGGSSLHGMLYENGPCISDGPNSTRYNEYSWTEAFNVIYLDQPAGVGFSYTDEPDSQALYPSHAEGSSLDTVVFIRLFYEAFPHLAQNDLHLSGESYAGRYVPALAASIVEYNECIYAANETIPLRSIMVGNPWIRPTVQVPAMSHVSCWPYRQYPPHLEPKECQRVLTLQEPCEALLQACEDGPRDAILCQQPQELCGDLLAIYINYTRSVYDRRLRHCPGPGDCYPDLTQPLEYLNSDEILLRGLEVPQQSGGRKNGWDMASTLIMDRYVASGDMFTSTLPHIQKILKYTRRGLPARFAGSGHRPVDVMFYVGVADIICNADGVFESLRSMKWEGRTLFRSKPWRELPWTTSGGGRAGRVKMVPNLWLVEMEEAGHMVPHDQPKSSLEMARLWLFHLQNGGGEESVEAFLKQKEVPEQAGVNEIDEL